jgi:hypothetical protein
MEHSKAILISYKATYKPCSRVFYRQGMFTSMNAFRAYARQWNTITLGKWIMEAID